MFIDKAEIFVKAGDGGPGAISFRREKFEPNGGPDGGDGGKGGDVVFVVDTGLNTLMDFKYQKRYIAPNGQKGEKKKMTGRSGDDLYIKVPLGTLIYEKNTNKIMADLSQKDSKVIICRGGRGGKGNTKYKSSIRQAPEFAKQGEEGEAFEIVLELKSIADVGLVGLPNAGKSSFLRKVSKARPKVADYPFTTLTPNLGVVEVGYRTSFIVADIPGLIEGASQGQGLGHDFLRHIERTKVILHVIDSSDVGERNIKDSYSMIRNELETFSNKLSKKPEIVFLNKIEVSDQEAVKEAIDYFNEIGVEVYTGSAITGESLDKLVEKLADLVEITPEEDFYTQDDLYVQEEKTREINCYVDDDGEYCVDGKTIEKIFADINFASVDSVRHFQKLLGKLGVYKRLHALGLEDGDTVNILNYQFIYRK